MAMQAPLKFVGPCSLNSDYSDFLQEPACGAATNRTCAASTLMVLSNWRRHDQTCTCTCTRNASAERRHENEPGCAQPDAPARARCVQLLRRYGAGQGQLHMGTGHPCAQGRLHQ